MADFQKSIDSFRDIGAPVVALSVDSAEHAEETVEKHRLEYPVLYGLDAHEMAERIGCYIDEEGEPPYLQATGFILDPEGRVAHATYSSGPIGRLVARDTAGKVEYMQKG